jgi:hypothetical protein
MESETKMFKHLTRSYLLLFAFLLLTLAITPIVAQTATATLSGTVQDENSAVIPGVQIVIKNYATSLERTATTNESGSFTVPLLPPGTYTVTATRDGFTPVKVTDLVLNVADQKSLSFQMKVGSVDAAVQVTPEASLVSTSPGVSTTVDRTFVSNLPLSGRSFQSLILLTPGIVATPSGLFTPGEFSVNGQRATANYFTVDGVSANTGVSTVGAGGGSAGAGIAFSQRAGGAAPGNTALGTTASLVSIDALEEFKIQTSTYSAEFGRQPGGQVQLLTRSGANQFHGTGFEYLRNDAVDATDWFYAPTKAAYAQNGLDLPKPELRQNQFGGTFSGPLMLPRFGEGDKTYWSGRNKTFFFFSYEGQRLRIPLLNGVQHVPSLRLRQAASPALQPILNAYPLPTGPENIFNGQPDGSAPFTTASSNPSSVDAYSIRIDQNVNSKLSLFGRYAYTPSSSLTRTLNQLTGSVLSNHTLTLGATLLISQQLNNEFRFNYTSNRGRSTFTLDNLGGAVPVDQSVLLSGYDGSENPKQGYLYFGLDGFGFPPLYSGADADNYSRQINIVDNVSLVKGAHQFKFGVDWRRLNPIYAPVAYLQNPSFYSQDSIISGTVDDLYIEINKGARPIFDNFSAYAQDDWKPSPRLTLDLGLRWEINPAPHDANGIRPVLLTGINGTDVSKATLAEPNAPYYKTFYTAFAPRVGLAYQLNRTSGRETVLRGGFGAYYDLGSGQATSLFSRFPFSTFSDVQNVPFPIPPALAQPPAFPAAGSSLAGQGLSALNPGLKLPYTLEWNVAVEQSVGRQQTVTLSYVASAARKLLTQQRLNQRSPNPFASPRPNPNFGNIYYTDNGPTSDYQSFQAQYQRRLSRGLQVLANYTWSHAIDQVSNEVDNGTLASGNADFDVRHNFSAAITYDIPKLSNNGFVKAIANGWSIDSTFYARTGTPLNLSAGQFYADGGILVNARPDVVSGQAFWIKDSSVAGGQRLNPAAFQAPPPYPGLPSFFNIVTRQGTLGRNVVRLPGIYQLNMAVRRQFSLGEQLKLQVKVEAFNVLNHPNFGSYGSFINDPTTLGVPQSMLATSLSPSGSGGLNSLYQIGGPRSMQFSARLSF